MGAVTTGSVMGVAYTLIILVMENVQMVLTTVMGTARQIPYAATTAAAAAATVQ